MTARIGILILLACFAAPGVLAQTAPAPGRVIQDCPTCPPLVVVPAGKFIMGTPKSQVANNETGEAPPVPMEIPKAFLLGRTEVTRAEFEVYASETKFEPKVLCRVYSKTKGRYDDDPNRSWKRPGVPERPQPNHPISCVDWHESKAYIAWLAKKTGKPYRLPTEAEWEYAARAGSQALYPWGPESGQACKYANVYDITTLRQIPLAWPHAMCMDGFVDIAPVGSLKPNAFGLYDMIGNVWEWAEDCATKSHVGRPKDGSAWVWQGGCKRVIQRGGGWFTSIERARPGYHGDATAKDHFDFGGFRVARDLLPEDGT
ncbi:MAG: SUMF1/EgtB/PvdO family nonheme iron enzyme [Rhodospirillaceae bacterium]|nr:SUMF1/EgtB/PvdO family nonheme iron enzyme [Rhodospirillaceae bacterium]